MMDRCRCWIILSIYILLSPAAAAAAAAADYHGSRWPSHGSSSNSLMSSSGGGLEDLRMFKTGIPDVQTEAPGPAENDHAPSPTVTLLLAGNQTKRPDILHGFRKYRGGWNITSKHYWASVGFTGTPGFILAIFWFFLFGIVLIIYHCGKTTTKKTVHHDQPQPNRPEMIRLLTLLLIFTCVSVTGCIVLSIGQVRFHGGVTRTLNYVVNQSDYTVDTLHNVTEYLAIARRINVSQVILPSDIGDDIDQLTIDLNSAARTLTEKTDENAHKIKRVFSSVRSALIAVASVMLILAIIGLVLSLRGHQGAAIHIFILSGWLLVAFTFLLCGLFVIFYSAIDDTCLAMQQWADNPSAETALTEILPCVDESTTNQTQLNSNKIVIGIINVINQFIYTYADTNRPPHDYFYYNQSGPLLPPLCYPQFQSTSTYCNPNEVSMVNASLVWKSFVCEADQNGTCLSVGRLTKSMYGEVATAVEIGYGIEHYTPRMLSLVNCGFVRETFIEITKEYCPSLEWDLRVVNVGLGLVSVGVMLCLVISILLHANRRHQHKIKVEVFAADKEEEKEEEVVTWKDGDDDDDDDVMVSPADSIKILTNEISIVYR